MRPFPFIKLPRWVVAWAVLPGVVGCGLDNYDKKFESESERIKKFDLADQSLANPIMYPMNVGTKQAPQYMQQEYIFLRPPAGFSSNSDNIPYFNFLYRFARGAPPAPIPAGSVAITTAQRDAFPPLSEKEISIAEIYVAFSIMDLKVDDFRAKLLGIFKGAQQLSNLRVDRVGREPITYSRWAWSDNAKPRSLYLIHGAQGDSATIAAVVIRIPEDKKDAATVQAAITYTLQSLVIGNAAANLNKNFKPRKEPGKKS